MKSPFDYKNPVVPPIFVGREEEIETGTQGLLTDNANLLILGYDGVGKSSLASTLLTKLNVEKKNKILTIKVNSEQFRKSFYSDFLSIITHMICVEVWCTVFGKRYTELMELSLVPMNKAIKIITPEEKTLLSIYNFITSEKLTSTRSMGSELGGKFIVEGKVTGKGEFGITRKPIQTFEFLKLLSELNDIIAAFGYQKILIFCDQLNHYPKEVNIDLIRDYFEIFSSNKVQFMLTAMPYNHEFIENFHSSFSGQVYVDPFKTVGNISDLINNCCELANSTKIEFRPESIDSIFDITEGFPRFVMEALDMYFKEALKKEVSVVDNDIISIHSINLAKGISSYKSEMHMLLGR